MFNERNEFVILQDDEWLKRQRIAGKAVSACLQNFNRLVKNKERVSLKDIENESVKILEEFDCTPTFLNYYGFPGAVCLSVNEAIVHGVPTDYELKDGDVATLDLGATFEGAIADAAFSCIYGDPKHTKHVDMLKSCQKALNKGIDAIQVGKRLGEIGYSIHSYTKDTEFGSVTDYGGHGLGYNKVHSEPFVSNKSTKNEGVVIQPNMTIAIEPMLLMCKNTKFKKSNDGHTLLADDIGCHFEHTIFIHENKVEIITGHDMEVL